MGDSHNKSKFTVKLPEQHTKLSTNIKGTIGEYQEIANLTKKVIGLQKLVIHSVHLI